MDVAITPMRSVNPGIVPPWLAKGSVAPQVPVPADQVKSAVAAPQLGNEKPAGVVAAGDGASSIVFRVPLGDGRVIVVDTEARGQGRQGGARTRQAVSPERSAQLAKAVAREQALVDATVTDVRSFFAKLGVRDNEGNGPANVVFRPDYPNASYNPNGDPEHGVPEDSLIIGVNPAEGRSFAVPDVIAHEWSHRVVNHLVRGKLDMSPFSEDVAIHETLSDTFAAAFDNDDWVMGDAFEKPIRVMNHPEQLGHPGHVRDLQQTFAPDSKFMHTPMMTNGQPVRDRSGRPVRVPDWHVVAGIPNKAASMIGDALGRDTMAKIYMKAVRDHVRPGQEIEGLASAVMVSAAELYGSGSRELQATRDAWDAVGILDVMKAQQQQPARR